MTQTLITSASALILWGKVMAVFLKAGLWHHPIMLICGKC